MKGYHIFKMYKIKLQELCQKRRWDMPVYATVQKGLQHMPSFTTEVEVCGQKFHTPAECKFSKDAQNTAARIALEHFNVAAAPVSPILNLSPNYTSFDTLHVYKNLLQRYAHKESLDLPEYSTEVEGPPHNPLYKSSVSIGVKSYTTLDNSHRPTFVSVATTLTYQGAGAKTKKLAEMNAAKVAYCTLKKGYAATETTRMNKRHVPDVLSTDIQGTTTIKRPHDEENEASGPFIDQGRNLKSRFRPSECVHGCRESNSVVIILQKMNGAHEGEGPSS